MNANAGTFAAVFAALFVAHFVGDQWVNAAKAVSTFPGVSVPSTKLVSRTNPGPVSGVAVVERRRPALKFTLAGGSRLIAGA